MVRGRWSGIRKRTTIKNLTIMTTKRNPATPSHLVKLAKEVLTIEAEGFSGLFTKIAHNLSQAVNILLKVVGRVIVTGVGKSGIVARKIVATLNSTGTSALFLHPVEAMHGDLGMVAARG